MTKSLVDSDYLKQAAELFQPIKRRSFELMGIKPGHTVLDVGCGPGDDLVALQGYKPGVDAIGVDADPDMVKAAKAKGADIWAFQDDVENLDLGGGQFDSVRAERVFMHLDSPVQALDEMVRVTKPGGRVVVVETDWTSLTVAALPTIAERLVSKYRVDQFLKCGLIGRDLYAMFKRRLDDVQVEITPLHTHDLALFDLMALSQEIEAEISKRHSIHGKYVKQLRENMAVLHENGEFFASVNILTVSGTKKEEAKC